jgi:hypothetical protein
MDTGAERSQNLFDINAITTSSYDLNFRVLWLGKKSMQELKELYSHPLGIDGSNLTICVTFCQLRRQ